MVFLAFVCTCALLSLVLAGKPTPQNAVNLTLFHVNPATYSAEPVNMDTADAQGDIFFDLRSVVLPLECAEDPTQHDCTNAEVVSPNLVITQIIVEADQRFSDYARCNVCVNGTDGHGHNNCTDGAYVCGCGERTSEPCKPGVGMENLTERYASRACRAGQKPWECWRDGVAKKTGGTWYSTLDLGHCGDPKSQACTWRLAKVVKRINKTCSDNTIFSTVERYDAESGVGCFNKCPSLGHFAPRNTSDLCWIQCFYETVLGKEAGKPGGKIEGMPFQKLLDAWHAPFNSDDATKGGCPHIPDVRDSDTAGTGSSIVASDHCECTGPCPDYGKWVCHYANGTVDQKYKYGDRADCVASCHSSASLMV